MNTSDSARVAIALFLMLPALAIAAPPPPTTALAYRPDGKVLAAGSRELWLLDANSHSVIKKITGQTGLVTALAWSRDGAWLAAASGLPSKSGEVRLYHSGSADPVKTIAAHSDRIHDLAFSPDGRLLATCSYDRLVKLWDVETGREVRTLKDHSDAVYGIAFRPDGKLLASVAADRAVKVWNVQTGTRLYTLGDATDWLYAVAWNPDGKHLAAAGVDKSIRVWEANEKEGKLVASAFAHEKPVLKLAFSADGKSLYSLGEDRIVKGWDAAKLVEKKIFPTESEAVLSVAVRPDGKELALGRYDGALIVLNSEEGKVISQPLPEKPKPPKISRISPDAAARGSSATVTFDGENLTDGLQLVSNPPGINAKSALERTANGARLRVEIDANVEPGIYQLRLKSAADESNPVTLFIDRFAASAEPAGTNSLRLAPQVQPQTTIAGNLSRAGEIDYFRIQLKAGEEIGVHAQPASGSKLEPVLAFQDSEGSQVADSSRGALGYRTPHDGVFVLSLRDREYRGGADFKYRLHLGNIPVVTSFSPLGLQRGISIPATIHGVFLGGELHPKVAAAPTAAFGSRVTVPIETKFGKAIHAPSLVVGEFPDFSAGQTVQIPGTANGTVAQPGQSQIWRFRAFKNKPLILEIDARRLGSPLDSVIEILNAKGEPVQRAILRAGQNQCGFSRSRCHRLGHSHGDLE